MAIKFNQPTRYEGSIPAFWRGDAKVAPAGYKILQTFPKGTLIRRGTLLSIVFGTLEANVVKRAQVIAGGTTIAPFVTKHHYFQVGDIVMNVNGTTGVTITAINTSDDEHDVLTFDVDLTTGASPGEHIVEATAAGASAAVKFIPNMVAGETTRPLDGDDHDTVSAVYDAVVLLGYVATVPDAWLTGVALKNNPNIIFLKQ